MSHKKANEAKEKKRHEIKEKSMKQNNLMYVSFFLAYIRFVAHYFELFLLNRLNHQFSLIIYQFFFQKAEI